jgi:hypothetical protein
MHATDFLYAKGEINDIAFFVRRDADTQAYKLERQSEDSKISHDQFMTIKGFHIRNFAEQNASELVLVLSEGETKDVHKSALIMMGQTHAECRACFQFFKRDEHGHVVLLDDERNCIMGPVSFTHYNTFDKLDDNLVEPYKRFKQIIATHVSQKQTATAQ